MTNTQWGLVHVASKALENMRAANSSYYLSFVCLISACQSHKEERWSWRVSNTAKRLMYDTQRYNKTSRIKTNGVFRSQTGCAGRHVASHYVWAGTDELSWMSSLFSQTKVQTSPTLINGTCYLDGSAKAWRWILATKNALRHATTKQV